jgi:hypothetical protein
MQAKTFGTWASFITSVGTGALTQSPDYSYLALPVAIISGTVFIVLAIMFLVSNRREIIALAKKVEPSHVIILGLVLAICGVLYRRSLQLFTNALMVVRQAETHPEDGELFEYSTKELEYIQDGFVRSAGDVKRWVDSVNKQIDIMVKAI